MIISKTEDKDLIKNFITNPILWEMAGYHGDPNQFTPNMDNLWLTALIANDFVCLMELRKFTSLIYDCHIYTLPEQMRKGIATEAVKQAIQWIKKNTQIKTLMLTVPFSCQHVIKFLANKTDFKICGMLHKSIIYQNRLEDLILYELEV